MKKLLLERIFIISVLILIGEYLESLSKYVLFLIISDNDLVCNCGVGEIDINMLYRYKDL